MLTDADLKLIRDAGLIDDAKLAEINAFLGARREPPDPPPGGGPAGERLFLGGAHHGDLRNRDGRAEGRA